MKDPKSKKCEKMLHQCSIDDVIPSWVLPPEIDVKDENCACTVSKYIYAFISRPAIDYLVT